MSLDFPDNDSIRDAKFELTPVIEETDEGWCYTIYNQDEDMVGQFCCFETEEAAEIACEEAMHWIGNNHARNMDYEDHTDLMGYMEEI